MADNTHELARVLEEIGAQLGVIARKSTEIESHLAKIAAHYPEPRPAPDIPIVAPIIIPGPPRGSVPT